MKAHSTPSSKAGKLISTRARLGFCANLTVTCFVCVVGRACVRVRTASFRAAAGEYEGHSPQMGRVRSSDLYLRRQI